MPPLILAAALLEGLSLTLIQGYLPLYVRRALGEPSYVVVSLVVAVPAIGAMIASNFWGGLSDISGKLKPVIVVGLLGYVAALALIPAVHAGLAIPLIAGTASFFYGTLAPSLKTYVTLRKPDRREQSIAFVLMSQSIGWLIGSLGAGRLLESGIGAGLRAALWTTAVLMLVHAMACALALEDQRREPMPRRDHGGWLAGIRADLASLYRNPALLRLCTLIFLVVSGNYVVWGFFSVFLVEHMGASIGTLRSVLAASSVLGIASFLYVGPLIRRFGGRVILAVGITLYLVMYAGIATARDPNVAAAFFALPLFSLVSVSANALASELSPAAQRGGGLGVLNGTYALATVVGPVTGGLLADHYGLSAVPWLALGFLSAAAPLAWFQVISSMPARLSGRIPR
jgi:predicted MFS family arabinose efflux permease